MYVCFCARILFASADRFWHAKPSRTTMVFEAGAGTPYLEPLHEIRWTGTTARPVFRPEEQIEQHGVEFPHMMVENLREKNGFMMS